MRVWSPIAIFLEAPEPEARLPIRILSEDPNCILPEVIVVTPVTWSPPENEPVPVADTLPETVSLEVGFVVPIPTLERVLIPTDVKFQRLSAEELIVTFPVEPEILIFVPAIIEVTIPVIPFPEPLKVPVALMFPVALIFPFA